MKIIITAEPEEVPHVVDLIMGHRHQFGRGPERLGWGWHYSIPSGRRFFFRQIKGGISASPVKDRP